MDLEEFSVVSYGGGVNSTALLIGLRNNGIIPSEILFADTGGEKPNTYDYLKTMNLWCFRNDFPEIKAVFRKNENGEMISLENDCLSKFTLPAIAFGYKTCSRQFKIQPQDKFINNHPYVMDLYKNNKKVVRYIGIDAGESHRAKLTEDNRFIYRYPLIEWDWGREECIHEIKKEGLPLPGKSSCFFCPSTKKREILELPESLKRRALKMEDNARYGLHSIMGLGRDFSWRDFLEGQSDSSVDSTVGENCICYDG